MRLGGPVYPKDLRDPEALIRKHRRAGYSAAYCRGYMADRAEREEFKQAFREADIVLAELGAYCLNVSDPIPAQRQRNIDEIKRRLAQADEMGALCCVMHGGSYNNNGCVKAHPDNFSEANVEHNVRVIRQILDEVQPKTTKLVLETESYTLPDSPQLYARMIKDVDHPGFAVHLDPVNIVLSPRRVYYSGDFIRECFALLGESIVSCHAKDTLLMDHATVQITETFVGNGTLDYGAYLTELSGLGRDVPLMIEHLTEEQLPQALNFLFGKAADLGLVFKHAERREIGLEPEPGGAR